MAKIELEDGPDPVEILKHQKKMLTALEYNKKYNRISYFVPNAKQLQFFQTPAVERMLISGNQIGKSSALAFETAIHCLGGPYPKWWGAGRTFLPENRPNIERPHSFLAWVSGPTSQTVRDTAQTKLLGPVADLGGLGTGFIPLSRIVGRPQMARGISNYVDSFSVRREDGTIATVRTKTYEQSRDAWQGETCDLIWFDEDPGRGDELYGEALARITATKGIIIASLTPLLGKTPIIRRFEDANEQRQTIHMSYLDASHLDEEQKRTLEGRYAPHERATRLFGTVMQGEGTVFMTAEADIKTTLKPADIPRHWPWIWGLDFSHGGQSSQAHPAGVVLVTWDRDHDVLYVIDAYRIRGSVAEQCARIRQSPVHDAPVTYGHDATQGVAGSAETIGSLYKKQGLRMLPKHACFPDGSIDLEAGVLAMDERFRNGRLKVTAHLSDFFEEYRNYHRENGKIVKHEDDILSALRFVVMNHRAARILDPNNPTAGYGSWGSYSRDARGKPMRAEGTEDYYFGID